MAKVKCYVSHSIRGKYGKDATTKQMQENNRKAMEFAKELRKGFPSVEFYIPGEHDEFVMLAYQNGYVTEEQILDIDCKIIDSCNFVLMYCPKYFFSRGMIVERDYAMDKIIPIVYNPDEKLCGRAIKSINIFLESLMC